MEGRSLCNHRRAYKFFIDSIAPRCLFPAFPCESYEKFVEGRCFMCDNNNGNDNTNQSVCGNMGYYADKSTGRGQLYLRTREEEPVNEKLKLITVLNYCYLNVNKKRNVLLIT